MRLTRRQRRALSWVPITVVAIICVAVAWGALSIQNSWWTDPAQTPSTDQVTDDGMSTFTRAGVDYLTRQGVVRIDLRETAEPAASLGLPASGSQQVEPLVPVRAILLGDDGVASVELVEALTLTTDADSVTTVELRPVAPTSWTAAVGQLREDAETWGWREEDFSRLEEELTAASGASDGEYAAALPPVTANGMTIGAMVTIRGEDAPVGLSYTFSPAGG